MKNICLTAAACMCLLASCSNDDKYEGLDRSGTKAEIYGNIAHSRMAGTTWAQNDAIGVTVKSGTEETASTLRTNVQYVTTDATGAFTAAVDGHDIHLLGTGPWELSAYYPYNGEEGTLAESIAVDASDQTKATTFDFLWAEADVDQIESEPAEKYEVNFAFTHRMSRIDLIFKNTNTAADAETSFSYKLKGLITDGTFAPATGVVTAGTTTTEFEVTGGTLSIDNTNVNNSFIVPPQTLEVNQVKIEITVGTTTTKYYSVAIPAIILDSTKKYTYTITVDDKLKVPAITVTANNITDWTEGITDGSGNLDATDDPSDTGLTTGGNDASATPTWTNGNNTTSVTSTEQSSGN